MDFLNNSIQLGVYLKFLIFKLNCRMFEMKRLYQIVKDSIITPSISTIKTLTDFKRTLPIHFFFLDNFLLLTFTSLQNI